MRSRLFGSTLVRGTWWHSYGTDPGLSEEIRNRIAGMADEVDASEAAPEAAMRLSAALDPQADAATAWLYRLAAEVLAGADDPQLAAVLWELRAVAWDVRARVVGEVDLLLPIPALEQPG